MISKLEPQLEASHTTSEPLVLLTGATGYIGGRLLTILEKSGHRVRCLARNPENLKTRISSHVEVVSGDVLNFGSLQLAMQGVTTAFYMVHSMGSATGFEDMDRKGAENFVNAAAEAGVSRIIYLGGLGDNSEQLSSHLRSRHEVGEILRSSSVQTIEFRASVVIGSGSLSFEIVRALTERLPVMITPKWASALSQPIAITDVVAYLLAAVTVQIEGNRIFEIGGPDQITYRGIMEEYAKLRNLTRWMISVPVLTPRLSSLWLGLVTPVYARVGRKLIDSIQHSTVIRDHAANDVFSIRPIGVSLAMAQALRNEDREMAETRWSDALSSGSTPKTWGGVRFGSRLVDSRTVHVNVPPAEAFRPIRQIGGSHGWYYGDFLWRIRGFLDLLVGGVGVRRGRRHPEYPVAGDALDFWRVEKYEPDRKMLLSAEMKLPGRAWLEFEVTADESGTTIRQTALFDPVGIGGLAYWYILFPLHELVFAGMLRGIARRAKASQSK